MNLSVVSRVDDVYADGLGGKTVVMIDVFRSSSCMVTALAAGATCILPADTVSKARELAGPGVLLGGERYGKKLDGFQLGNSPSDYTPDKVRNRGIVMTTTNGTRALSKATRAAHLFIGCFLNAAACARRVNRLQKDVVLLCAGTRGHFSLEDGMAAGCLIDHLMRMNPANRCDDLGRALHFGFLSCRDGLFESLSLSESGQRLLREGLERDIHACLETDRYDIIPQWERGRLVSSVQS